MASDEIASRLDTLIALTRLAYRHQIQAVRTEILQDSVYAAILEAAEEDWVGAGDLKRKTSAATGQSERTVVRRVGELVRLGVLEQDGAGGSVKYRGTDLLN